METDEVSFSQEEREKLQTDIERMKEALRTAADDESSDSNSDGASEVSGGLQIVLDNAETETLGENEDNTSNIFSLEKKDSSPSVCLFLNRMYQEVVNDYIKQIDKALKENADKQEQLAKNHESQAEERSSASRGCHRVPFSSFYKPYFTDVNGMIPPSNAETLEKKRRYLEAGPYAKVPYRWSSAEKTKLRAAVKTDTLRRRMQPLLNKKELEHERMDCLEEDSAQYKVAEKKIENYEEEISKIRRSTDTQLVYGSVEESDKVDWLKISTIDFDATRDEINCRQMWKTALNPSINSSRWKPAEEEKLVELADQHQNSDWVTIAEKLGTNRSAFQCIQRFMTKLNPCLATGKWSQAEDDILREVVSEVSTGPSIPWNTVAYYMEGRSQEQCSRRWAFINPVHNALNKGRWTEEEDKRLREAIKRIGALKWTHVAQYVGTRDHHQCRERYVNSVKYSYTKAPWTYEEDRKLWQLGKEFPDQWCVIASHMTGRSDNMCLQRFNRLKKWMHQNTLFQELPPKVKSALEENTRNILELQTAKEEQKMEEIELKMEHIEKNVVMAEDLHSVMLATGVDLSPEDFAELKKAKDALYKQECERHKLFMKRLTNPKDKALREDIERHKKEFILIKKDLDKGIYIPRPESATHIMTPLRSWIENMVKQDVAEEEMANKVSQIGGNVSIRNILAVVEGDKARSQKAGKGQGRCRKSAEEAKVDKELEQVCKQRSTHSKARGRPRKYLRFLERSDEEEVDEQEVVSNLRRALRGDKFTSSESITITDDEDDNDDEDDDDEDADNQFNPLPPSVCSLNAFKSLLLSRRALMQRAGAFYKPSLLPGKQEDAEEDSCDDIIEVNLIDRVKETAEYRAMKQKVTSLFFWPALLSTVSISEDVKVNKQGPDGSSQLLPKYKRRYGARKRKCHTTQVVNAGPSTEQPSDVKPRKIVKRRVHEKVRGSRRLEIKRELAEQELVQAEALHGLEQRLQASNTQNPPESPASSVSHQSEASNTQNSAESRIPSESHQSEPSSSQTPSSFIFIPLNPLQQQQQSVQPGSVLVPSALAGDLGGTNIVLPSREVLQRIAQFHQQWQRSDLSADSSATSEIPDVLPIPEQKKLLDDSP